MESSQALPPALSILEHGVREDFYHDDPVQDNTGRKFHGKFLTTAVVIFASVFFFQSTLASNISLNSSQGIEFGQGISQAVACSGNENLTVTPYSSFVNAANSTGTYYLQSVKVSNIPSSCYGVDFTINAFGNSESAPLALFNSTSTAAVIYNNAGTFELGVGTVSGASISSGSGTFTITFTNPVALSTSVFKVTLQSGVHVAVTCASGGTCVVGDTGPGGGAIFYTASTPFACGPTRSATCTYLEAAPSGWNGGADPSRRWANTTYQSTTVNNATSPETATATAIGWGYRNTRAIILQGNTATATSAAALADSHTVTVSGVTYDDWYLPSRDELNQMCKWQRGITGADLTNLNIVCSFDGTYNTGKGAAGFSQSYWSSSESPPYAWQQNLYYGGYQDQSGKANLINVRPVRAF
jgi:hypothetical protein